MNGVHVSWYLSGLFVFALVATSAITVAPGGEMETRVLEMTCAGCAVLFAGVAIVLLRKGRTCSPACRTSKWVFRLYVGWAVIATFLVLALTVG